MKCVVNWIPLKSAFVREIPNPTLKKGRNGPHVSNLKGGPEPLEKEINEILGSKREDRLPDPFFELVQNTTLVRFSYLLRLCNFCKAPQDMQKFPQK